MSNYQSSFNCFLYILDSNLVKHIESANTMFSFIWWLLGFYWVTAGGQELIDDSPQLYWSGFLILKPMVF